MDKRQALIVNADLQVRPHPLDFFTVEIYYPSNLPGAICEFVRVQVEARMCLEDIKRHADALALQMGYPEPLALYVGERDTVPSNQVLQ